MLLTIAIQRPIDRGSTLAFASTFLIMGRGMCDTEDCMLVLKSHGRDTALLPTLHWPEQATWWHLISDGGHSQGVPGREPEMPLFKFKDIVENLHIP